MSSKSPSQIKVGSRITLTKSVRKLVAFSIPAAAAAKMAGRTFEVDDVQLSGTEDAHYRCKGSNLSPSGSGWWVANKHVVSVTKPIEIEEAVINSIRARRDAGREKYKTTMERKDLTFMQWLQHLQEELLDAAIYVEKLKREGGAK